MICKTSFTFALFLAVNCVTAQSQLIHSISAHTGVSVPVGIFAKDSPGKGHGFANPGYAVQIFYEAHRSEQKINFLAGLTFIGNPLDRQRWLAMYPLPNSMQSKCYNLSGISGGAALHLSRTGVLTWQLRGTVGLATISYPAQKLYITVDDPPQLIYSSSADNSIGLNGSLGLRAQRRLSSKIGITVQADYFRSRARHVITYYMPTLVPSTYEESIIQEIAMVNVQIGASYSL